MPHADIIYRNPAFVAAAKGLFISLVFLFGCRSKFDQAESVTADAFVIYAVNVVDVSTGAISSDRCILIDNGIIGEIGDSVSMPVLPHDRWIDGRDMYVIPGLWDMHIHIEGEDLVDDNKALLPVYIAYGITTVRDCASDLGELVLKWRDDIAQDRMFGPRILTAGRKLEGKESMWKGDLEIANEVELQQMLDLLDQYKVDFVKITENTLAGDLFLKSVEEAHNRGYKVAGHVPIDLTIEEVVDAGFSSIEHATYVLRLGSDERNVVAGLREGTITPQDANNGYIENFDQETARLGYERLAAKGVAITPTLIGGKQLAFLDEDDHKKDEFRKYLTRRFLSKYTWRIERMSNETPEQREQRKHRYRLTAAQLPYLQHSGVTILAGSDAAALNTYVYPALSLHEELVLFQEAGLSPLEILQTATINAARFTDRLDSLGTVETGKIADLVILRENPLVTISNTQGIQAVVLGGHYFDRDDLDSMLLAAEEQRIKLDSARQD